MATENKVLTLAEVLALPEGAKVWVEIDRNTRKNVPDAEGEFAKRGNKLFDDWMMNWTIGSAAHGIKFRVWSLPQPPTQEEMDANPWEVQHG